ncbi:MAG TPA: efflux RND transporter permease subunit [Candidatus Sulfotelmatobacter sp.]|jgi:HAE1 family hydrophobic/amphiphilic exporter-1|nr:efflux RND transporter permease subunit [Candidatus Sulfotelmatobacter sp.]
MKIAETCVKHPVFTVMLIAFLLTLGVFSYRGLAVDLFPKADPATVNVEVTLPGATPEEMVTGIVLPLEDAISSVNGIDEMSVYASQGLADITCTFVLERDIDGAAQDIREKVAAAVNRLPRETLPPVITKEDPQSDPIMTLLVSGPMSRRELTEIADKQVRRAIQTVNGVGSVELNGGQARQIRVLIDAQKLTSHNFTVLDVRNALQRENIEAPGGRMITGPQELGLRTLGRVTSADQFSQIVVGTHGGIPVRIHDVAQVEDAAQELRTWSAFFNKTNPGEDVVSIQILRQSGANTVRVADNVRDQIEQLRSQMPPGVQLLIVHDVSDFIKASVHSLIEHLILGSIFASAIVWLFIRNWRAVLIAAVAIPSSIIATFTLMRAMDFSLNNMTLLALTLAVGIVIDDAIIVLENIVRFMEDKGRDRVQAAIEATQEIGLAVMATTLSLIIIFLPIAFMNGYARKYVNSFGWTMAMAILVSLLVAFTLTPMMSSRLLKVDEKSESHSRGFLYSVEETYMRMLRWSLAHRGVLVMICLATFLSTFALYHLVGRDWIPADDQSELQSSFTLPEGTSLQKTSEIASDMARRVSALPEVAFVQCYTHGPTNHAHLFIGLVPRSQRKLSHSQLATRVRDILATYHNVTYNVRLPSVLGGEIYFPISAVIRGPDLNQLAEISKQVADRMRNYPDLVDVNPSLNLNTPELQVKVDRQRAADIGVRMTDISDAVRLFYSGEDEITRFKEGSEQYPVTMQLLPEQRDNPDVLSRMMVPSSKLGQVRLESVANIGRGFGPATLWRYNREFEVSVYANVNTGYPLDMAAAHTIQSIHEIGLPAGYNYLFSGQVKVLEETTWNLLLAMLLASIFMYMVLAAQFESFSYPFIIMLTLPLSVPFALFSLWITGRALSLWSALGMFLLLGIVKKNGILQVDYTNRLMAEGLPVREAILEANRVRLRPILMTTLSIIAGLIPVAIGIGAGSEQRASIAVTIIGGQTLCLLLTLLVVPVAYSYFAELEALPWGQWMGRVFKRARHPSSSSDEV